MMKLARSAARNIDRRDTRASLLPLIAVAFVLLVCATFVGLEIVNAVDHRRREVESAWQAATNLARSLAQHAQDTFQAVDASIIGIAQRLQIDGTGEPALNALHRIMTARLATFPALANIVIIDAAGNCIASGHPLPPGDCNFGASENFWRERGQAKSEPYLGAPVHGTGSGSWVIPLSRRFESPDGGFGGIVVGAVSIPLIAQFYGTLDVGTQGAILLATTDAKLLVRRPLREGEIGRDLSNGPLFRDLWPKAKSGSAELTSISDGATRFTSYQTVAGFPLVVSVAFGKDEVLANWAADLRSRFARTAGLVLIIGALGTWLVLQIRRHQRLEEAYRDTASAFRLLAENSSDLIVRAGPDMRRAYVSPASREVLGYEPEELLGRATDDIVHPDDRQLWQDIFGEGNRDQVSDLQATYRVLRKDGTPIWVEVCRRRLASGEGFVISSRDVTRRKTAEDKLEDANRQLTLMANQDALTGIANRRHFETVFETEFRRAKREETPLSLIMIDVDRFKAFNDRYGHPAGDRCLREIGRVLSTLPGRAGDLVARYGGEELAMLLPNTPQSGAAQVAERARQAVRALAMAHAGNEAKVVTISLGVATFAPDEAIESADDLVAAADQALYRAKGQGRDMVCVAGDDSPKRLSA